MQIYLVCQRMRHDECARFYLYVHSLNHLEIGTDRIGAFITGVYRILNIDRIVVIKRAKQFFIYLNINGLFYVYIYDT